MNRMYTIILHVRARKTYDRLDAKMRRRINEALERVADDPFGAPNIAPLKGEFAGLHRIRVGDYRVVVAIRSQTRELFVLSMDVRGNIYKQ